MNELTADDWLNGLYYVMEITERLGAKIYPLIVGFNILKILGGVI